ncbi:MAG: CocE/NonD family hydrolase [Candidatus Heimdallarchaeum endolithica]|uniref:CocE/NonD family hydrolase n=1 Tax=Candidatus Heimdallarchaeum endolithica TaxID=2876572 RepID=A0A9Y1BRF7_9ARCH|nr:MAG: CocE/NonD family hydrolase [Candidatus Heimdallarchaeum endolithica]
MKRYIQSIILIGIVSISLLTGIYTVIIINNNKTSQEFNWTIPLNASIHGNSYKITYYVKMNDGVKLATDLYVPKDINSSLPVIFIRTPYNKNELEIFSLYVDEDYAIVIQDFRGYFASEGEKTMPFFPESEDGKKSLEWISSQPWCNGKIGTWGPSALAIAQYLLAPNASEELKCQVPIVGTPDVYEAAFRGGALRSELMVPWMVAQGYTIEEINNFVDMEKLDNRWDPVRIVNNYKDIHVPAMHIGGWYDIFTQNTIDAFIGYQTQGGEGAAGNSKLVMGPWTHVGGFGALASGEYKGLPYIYPNQKAGMIIDLGDIVFEKWLKNNSTRWENLPDVIFYLMSSLPYNNNKLGNNWYSSNHWPLETEEQTLFFNNDMSLSTTQEENENSAISYLYDPLNPVPTEGGGNLALKAGTYDQRDLEKRGDVLTFTSETLKEPVTVIGQIKVMLEISTNCTDTDFTVKLTDVFPDNTSMLITDTIIRARNRNSYSTWDFLESEKRYILNITLDSTAYVFTPGHKIRLDISSSNYPRFETNPNTGEPLWQNSTTYVANNTMFMANSKVILPTYDYDKLIPFNPNLSNLNSNKESKEILVTKVNNYFSLIESNYNINYKSYSNKIPSVNQIIKIEEQKVKITQILPLFVKRIKK